MKHLITSFLTLALLTTAVGYGATLVPSKNVKIVIFAPSTHGDAVRKAMAEAGAGRFGDKYDFCSFTMSGTGRWRALEGANPAIGAIGLLEASVEDRIEAICPIDHLEAMLDSVKKVHPYEVVGYDIYPLLDLE